MPPPKCVVGHKKDEHACPYHAAPIHLARGWVWSSRKELKEPEHGKEAQRNDVDRVAGFAKIEPRRWERFATESLLEDTCDL